MQYSSEFIMQMRNHFSQLSEKEKAIFAGAEAMKHGEKGPQIAGEILGCSYATVSSGLEMIASRGIKKSATVISDIFGEGEHTSRDHWDNSDISIQDFANMVRAKGGRFGALSDIRRIGKHINSFRAVLNRSEFWPTGVKRAHNLCRDTWDELRSYIDLQGKSFLDLGCGNSQPFGTSAIMYLNGVSNIVALDIVDTSPTRAAVALYDILASVRLFPDDWHWSDIPREEFIDRIYHFDLNALNIGDLSGGLGGVPIKHVVKDVSLVDDLDAQFDATSSRVVLEHFLQFEDANRKVFEMLKPGGIACHRIDLSDHRKKRGHHAFSFLAEEVWNGDTNRLRSSEIRDCFEGIGYEILQYDERRGNLPDGFHKQMLPKYQVMDQKDVEVIEVICVLQRPY